MTTPKVEGPRDVPALRTFLETQWKTSFRYGLESVSGSVEENVYITNRTLSRTAAEWEIPALHDATLWWVTEEMCDLLAAAEDQLPDDTILEPELVPGRSGLVVFAKSFAGVDAQSGLKIVVVDALLWGLVQLPPTPGYIDNVQGALALAISSYRKLVFDGTQDEHLAGLAIQSGALLDPTVDWREIRGEMWSPLGRSDWLFNKALDHRHAPLSDESLASMIEDRRRVATMWLLQAQEGITQTELSEGSRAERRRAEREGAPAPTVRVVNINRRRSRHDPGEDDDSERRHLTVRSLVQPYWRRHPYHPSCEECQKKHQACGNHRPKYINAFWRGPEDAPMSKTQKVRVWK